MKRPLEAKKSRGNSNLFPKNQSEGNEGAITASTVEGLKLKVDFIEDKNSKH